MTCTNRSHDHLSTTDPATGETLEAPLPMRCTHCHQRAHYDYGSDTYEHDDPTAAGCYLIPHRSATASPCRPPAGSPAPTRDIG